MKQQPVETTKLGLTFTFLVPDSIAEYNKLAARGDLAVLDDAIDTNIYRSGLPDAWEQLADRLMADHNIPKKTKPHSNPERAAKGEVIDAESDPAYCERVAAEKTLDKAALQAIVNEFGVIELDLTERKGGGKGLIGKADLDMAATYINAGPEKCNAALSKIAATTNLPQVTLTGDFAVDQKAVALAIKAFRSAMAASLIK